MSNDIRELIQEVNEISWNSWRSQSSYETIRGRLGELGVQLREIERPKTINAVFDRVFRCYRTVGQNACIEFQEGRKYNGLVTAVTCDGDPFEVPDNIRFHMYLIDKGSNAEINVNPAEWAKDPEFAIIKAMENPAESNGMGKLFMATKSLPSYDFATSADAVEKGSCKKASGQWQRCRNLVYFSVLLYLWCIVWVYSERYRLLAFWGERSG